MDARLLRERQHALRKAFQQRFRAAFKAPPSGARVAEVRPDGLGNVGDSTFLGQGGTFVYFKAYDKDGNPTGEEWEASSQGSDDLRPREFRVKRARSPSHDESAGSDGEVDTGAESDVEANEAPATSRKGKGKAKATDDAEKPARPVSSTPRKPRRAPAPKRVRRMPGKKPAEDLDDEYVEMAANGESHVGRNCERQRSEPPVASTSGSGSASHTAGPSLSVAVAVEANSPLPTAAGVEVQPEGNLGRGKRITRGCRGRTHSSPARNFGPAFAIASDAVVVTFDTPTFQKSPYKTPPSIGGESVLERLCSQVDELDVESSAASAIMDTDTERGTPAPEAAPAVDDNDRDREATPVAPVVSSSPVARSASKGKGRAV